MIRQGDLFFQASVQNLDSRLASGHLAGHHRYFAGFGFLGSRAAGPFTGYHRYYATACALFLKRFQFVHAFIPFLWSSIMFSNDDTRIYNNIWFVNDSLFLNRRKRHEKDAKKKNRERTPMDSNEKHFYPFGQAFHPGLW